MKRTAVFTIVSKNYLHFARTLMNSVQKHHPEWERHVLLVDETGGDFDPEKEAFKVNLVKDINLPNYKQFLFRYTILELNTAVKPFMFDWLFKTGQFDKVLYIDPDIYLYDTMDEVIEALDNGSLMVLTPHLTGYLADGKRPNELDILRAGTYNLGFLAVAKHNDTQTFIDWWKSKLEFDCVVDFPNGLFVDQKWMDLVPGFFEDVYILRHPGYNVAYWNLNHRTFEKVDGKLYVNGNRLVFFHFSGLDPNNTSNFSKYQDRFTTDTLDKNVNELVSAYASNVLGFGYDTCRNWNYAFSKFENGKIISDFARYAYRNSKSIRRRCGDDPFKHPEVFVSIRYFIIERLLRPLEKHAKNLLKENLPAATKRKIKNFVRKG